LPTSAIEDRGSRNLLDLWFRPKPCETERLYVRLGALVLKRYVPTGGDVVMRWLRRHNPNYGLIDGSPESLRRFERWTRTALLPSPGWPYAGSPPDPSPKPGWLSLRS
jgi:hypothetical protein